MTITKNEAAVFALGVSIVLLFAAALWPNEPKDMLVGFDCDGTHGPIYATQEDYFPECNVIRRTR